MADLSAGAHRVTCVFDSLQDSVITSEADNKCPN
jgi:hypothetical protein